MPVHFGFCPSEQAWRREMRRLKSDHPYPKSNASATYFEKKPWHSHCVLVTVSKHNQGRIDVAELICHEAMHVWRFIREVIGEEHPSAEFEAYAMQAIFGQLYSAYLKTRGR